MLKKILVQVKTPIQIQEDKEYKLVTISNTGNITLRKVIKGSQISADQAYSVKKGAFIYSRLSIHTGAFGLVPDELDGALVTSEMPLFDIMDNTVPDFLIYSLKLPEFSFQLNNLTKGMGRTRVKEDTFLSLHIDIPSIEIQKRLIKEISDKENQISLITQEHLKQIDALKKLRQQILQDAVQGKLVPQDTYDEPASKLLERIKADKEKLVREKKIKKEKNLLSFRQEEIPFEIPNNWIWCRFGEVVDMSRGRFSIRPRNDPRYFNGNYPFIQIGSLDENGSVVNNASQTLNELGKNVSKEFPVGTIAIAIVGGTIGNLGVLGRNMFFPDSIIGITPSHLYNQQYVLYFLRYKQPAIKAESYQMAGQPNIKIPTLFNLLFPLPSISEQNRIVAKLDQLMTLCDELEQSIQQNQKFTQEFLQVALKEALEQMN